MNTVTTSHTTMRKKNQCVIYYAIIFLGLCGTVNLLKQKKLQRDYSVSKGKSIQYGHIFYCFSFPEVNHISLFSYITFQALLKNAKVEVVNGDTFKFKPALPVSNRKELLVCLKKRERCGMGGIYEEQVEEALPDAKKHIEVRTQATVFDGSY